jgi:sugar phosphate permease
MFLLGFCINGPKALLQLTASQHILTALRRSSSSGSQGCAGTVSGLVGLSAQLGAACSGTLAVYLQLDYAYFFPSLVLLCCALVALLAMCCLLSHACVSRSAAGKKAKVS